MMNINKDHYNDVITLITVLGLKKNSHWRVYST